MNREQFNKLPVNLIVGGILAIVAVIYLPTLRFGLIYDDSWTLISNGFLREPDVALLFSPDAVDLHIPDAFRPTLVLFDILSYQLFGVHPAAQHALSVVLHLAVCGTMYLWLTGYDIPRLERIGATSLFGMLAIHAEVVSVVSYREDLLAALFGLLALHSVNSGIYQNTFRFVIRLGLGLFFLTLACNAKMSASPLPIIWLLGATVLIPGKKELSRVRLVAAFSTLSFGVALALSHRYWLYDSVSPYTTAQTTGDESLLSFTEERSPILAASVQIHVQYLIQTLFPARFSPEYVDFRAQWSDRSTIVSTFVLLGLLCTSLYGLRHRRFLIPSFAVLSSLLLALPTANLIAMPNMRADRFMYLPSIAACIGMSALAISIGHNLHRVLLKFPTKNALTPDPTVFQLGTLCLWCIWQGSQAIATSITYASNTNLWKQADRYAPDSSRTQAMVGLQLLRQSPIRSNLDNDIATKVRSRCEKAIDLDRHHELSLLCFARLAIAEKKWEIADQYFRKALEVSDQRKDRILAPLARIQLDLPPRPEVNSTAIAVQILKDGLRQYPFSNELHTALARVLHFDGKHASALHHYQRARSLRPERWETAVYGLELALDVGDVRSALRTWHHHPEVFDRAGPIIRNSLAARLGDARRLAQCSDLEAILSAGVFLDDS